MLGLFVFLVGTAATGFLGYTLGQARVKRPEPELEPEEMALLLEDGARRFMKYANDTCAPNGHYALYTQSTVLAVDLFKEAKKIRREENDRLLLED